MPFLMNFSIFYIGLLTVWCIFDSTGAVRYGYIEIYEFYLSLYCLLLFVYKQRLGRDKHENCVFVCLCARLSLYLDNIGCGSAKSNMKTVFSFAIALTFRYICSV